jgi:hypothetical protein
VDAAAIVGLLAEPRRRRVVAALVLGATTIADVRRTTGFDQRDAVTALGRLVDAGLVVVDEDGRHWVVEEAFALAARQSAPAPEPDTGPEAESSEQARVLRSFVRDGRLLSIPAQHAKRLEILDRLAQEVEPGRRYPEREVNTRLARWHPDTAALRRYLVDDGFLERDAGEYWRSGGTFVT